MIDGITSSLVKKISDHMKAVNNSKNKKPEQINKRVC